MFKVTDLESPVKDGCKRVRFAKHVMEFAPGDIADIPMDKVEHLCSEREIAQGENRFLKFRNAIPLEEALKMDEALANATDLTVDEMQAAGRKNIVKTPDDDAFAKSLKARAQKLNDDDEDDGDDDDAESDGKETKAQRKKRQRAEKAAAKAGQTSNQLEASGAQ